MNKTILKIEKSDSCHWIIFNEEKYPCMIIYIVHSEDILDNLKVNEAVKYSGRWFLYFVELYHILLGSRCSQSGGAIWHEYFLENRVAVADYVDSPNVAGVMGED